MIDAQQLLLFIAAGWLLNLTPGPDVLYIVTRALKNGLRVGLVAGLGIAAGCLVHVGAAAVGVGALLAASSTAFTLLKWLGAAYLLWLGIGALRSRARVQLDGSAATAAPQSMWRNVARGFVANAVNPKVALFFMAFLPQFVTAGAPAGPQMVVLGALFAAQTVIVFGAIAAAAGTLGSVLARKPQLAAWLDRGSGALLIALAIHLLVSPRPT